MCAKNDQIISIQQLAKFYVINLIHSAKPRQNTSHEQRRKCSDAVLFEQMPRISASLEQY